MSARVAVDLCERGAPPATRPTKLVREADDHGDWKAAGCSSSAQWLAQLSSSDYRTAAAHHANQRRAPPPARARPRPRAPALSRSTRSQPQRPLRPPRATPRSRASRSVKRPARSRSPRARSSRPRSTDDQELYQRRALSMTWTNGGRELVLRRAPATRARRRVRASHPQHRQDPTRPATNRPASPSTGNNPPPTRSSPSPARTATAPTA